MIEPELMVVVYIYVPGDRYRATEVCADFSKDTTVCTAIGPCTFAYDGDASPGVRILLMNSTGAPVTAVELEAKARELGQMLIERLSQRLCAIVGPETTVWLSARDS